MGHRTTRPPGRRKPEAGGPSWRFILFAVIGLAVLIWIVIVLISQPMKPPLQ
jgi:hypothetical protein